jgi:hypothetical protein
MAKVGNQRGFVVNGEVFIALSAEQTDKFALKLYLRLVLVSAEVFSGILSDNRAFAGDCDDVV